MSLRLHTLIAALAFLPLAAAPASTPVAPDIETIIKSSQLHIARNGDEVVVSWDLPAGLQIKGLDIYRNTREATSGRKRVDFVGATPAVFRDKVPDGSEAYWYWIKIVLTTGQFVNIGPVKTPGAVVWTP